MNNNSILLQRWQEVDNYLSTFYARNMSNDKKMYKELQDIFNGLEITNLYDYSKIKDVAKLRVLIQEIEEEKGLQGYLGYELKLLRHRKKIRYTDLIRGFVLAVFYKYYMKQKDLELDYFNNIVKYTYKNSQQEVIDLTESDNKVSKITDSFLSTLLLVCLYNGHNWFDYRQGVVKYNADLIYKEVILKLLGKKKIDLSDDDFEKIKKKIQKDYLTKKELKDKKGYQDEFYGSLDKMTAELVNKTTEEAYKEQNVFKALFIAVIDEKTTKMCNSLNGQVFNLQGRNIFTRYSAEDESEIKYDVYGLVLGINLPPIENHFHYCRSTIYPFIDRK